MDIKHITPKTVIVVTRRWHRPEVLAYVNQAEVGAQMPVSDFIRALAEEVYGDRNRFVMLSRSEFLDKSLAAADSILATMKETTTHVV
jgi:hypothetical protein